MLAFTINVAVSFTTSLLAVLVALWIEHKRQPDIDITTGEGANADRTYPVGHLYSNERWKYFRVRVTNKPFPFPFSWIPRYTAQNCSAQIIFSRVDSDSKFTMKGRWVDTPEPPHLSRDQAFLKVLFPDSVSIPPGSSQTLDVFTQQENDRCGFGWNNEAYLHEWRTPAYKLERGLYDVIVTVTTQNGVNIFWVFKCQIGDRIEDSSLVEELA